MSLTDIRASELEDGMKIIWGLDTGSIEDLQQAVVVDVPIEYSDNDYELEEFLSEQVSEDDIVYITDLLRDREYIKYHLSSADIPCPACGAVWRTSEAHQGVVLIHDENCGYLKWKEAVSA